MRPELFHIGGFTVYSFGLMAALALIVPGLVIVLPAAATPRRQHRLRLRADRGRAASAASSARASTTWPSTGATSAATSGDTSSRGIGFTWYGGLIGGFLAVVAWCLIRRVPLGIVANTMGPAVALGYAIGRVGCQLAGDGDYGKPSDLPWAMGYPHGTVPTPPGVTVHPTPIYEIIMMAPIIWVLWRLAHRDHSGWWTFGWMLVLTGVERFVVEFVRRNAVVALGLTQPQFVAIVSVAIGTVLVLVFRDRPAERAA